MFIFLFIILALIALFLSGLYLLSRLVEVLEALAFARGVFIMTRETVQSRFNQIRRKKEARSKEMEPDKNPEQI